MKPLIFLSVIALLAGCQPSSPDRGNKALVEVRCVKIHHFGDNGGGWHDPFTHAVYERTDTHERLVSSTIFGEVGEVFTVNPDTLHAPN